jgi:hypothetical protein
MQIVVVTVAAVVVAEVVGVGVVQKKALEVAVMVLLVVVTLVFVSQRAKEVIPKVFPSVDEVGEKADISQVVDEERLPTLFHHPWVLKVALNVLCCFSVLC